MRVMIFGMALAIAFGGLAQAQEAPPPQNQPPAQLAPPPPPAAPDAARMQQADHYQSLSHKLSIGGKVSLGVGIPLLVIGVTLAVLANVNNGAYLCSGISCDFGLASDLGYTFTTLGVLGLGGGIAMLVLSSSYHDKAQRLRSGMALMKLLPRVQPLARIGGRGFDGMKVAWGFDF